MRSVMDRLNDEGVFRGWSSGSWWQRAALCAIASGQYAAILDRKQEDLYLLRCWLSPARRIEGDERWNSGESLLLHWIRQSDDDGAMHDHPWDFRSQILSGGYVEQLPYPGELWSTHGPARTVLRERNVGDVVRHRAADLHRIESIQPNTWSLVQTGPKVRSWGFHAAGAPWRGWREYLGIPETEGATT